MVIFLSAAAGKCWTNSRLFCCGCTGDHMVGRWWGQPSLHKALFRAAVSEAFMLALSPLAHVWCPPHGILVSTIAFAIFLHMESFYQVPSPPLALPSSEMQNIVRRNLWQIPGLCTSLWHLTVACIYNVQDSIMLSSPSFLLWRKRILSYKNLSRPVLSNPDVFLFNSLLFAANECTQGIPLHNSATFLSFNPFVLFFLPSSPPHPRSYCTSCPSSLRKTTSISCSNISAAQRAWTKKDCTRRPLSGSAHAASGRLKSTAP